MEAIYQTIDQRPALRFERRLAHPVEAVWRAITDPRELEHWFPSSVDYEAKPGAEMSFTFREHTLPDGSNVMPGRVTHFDPPRVFAFDWGGDHLRFELERTEGGTLLRFTAFLDAKDKAARDAAGWHHCLNGLERALDSDADGPNEGDDWRSYYERYAAQGFPTGAPVPDGA